MSTGNPKRTRSQRVAGVVLSPSLWVKSLTALRQKSVLIRIALAAGAVLLMWAITGAWAPPLAFRKGDVPRRTVVARVDFQQVDLQATQEAQDEKRKEIEVIYEHDPAELIQLLEDLKGKVLQITRAKTFEELDEGVRLEFFERAGPDEPAMAEGTRQDIFDNFRLALEEDADLAEFEAGVKRAFADYLLDGLLEKLEHTSEQGTLLQIGVRPKATTQKPRLLQVEQVRIGEILPELQQRLASELQSEAISAPTYLWLAERLESTLHTNEATWAETQRAQDEAASQVEQIYRDFKAGETVLAHAGVELGQKADSAEMVQLSPNGEEAYDLLSEEHLAYLGTMSTTKRLLHSLADFGMYLALYILCGFYIYFRQPELLRDLRKFSTLLGVIVATIGLTWVAALDEWRAEAIPLVLFAMAAAIAYRYELALLLSGSVCLIFTVSARLGLAEFTVLLAAMSASILLLGRIRSRTKLLYVGLAAGLVAAMTSLGVGTLVGAPDNLNLLLDSLWIGACAVVAGLLMTGLLPFVESLFEKQTDISLLELGDAAHPLLQELVRRAPGTYNHSINVASIAEAAADAIGANGLLCRVGAYFHDIGKMLKPGYFIENQAEGVNRHDTLEPAMSTLVIIAHVKDGADLARQHGLPKSIIDFIQQHHGTTLVEYFYREASRKSEENPDASQVEEADFRYPGPKPQSKEAGVMMLADSVESASRTLVEPTPARIESLVEKLAMKRLLDGQFDESGLTLSELRIVQDSLVKSLTAVYHGRVIYPEQKTA